MKLTVEDLGTVIPKHFAAFAVAAMARAAKANNLTIDDATDVNCRKNGGIYLVSAKFDGEWYDWADK